MEQTTMTVLQSALMALQTQLDALRHELRYELQPIQYVGVVAPARVAMLEQERYALSEVIEAMRNEMSNQGWQL